MRLLEDLINRGFRELYARKEASGQRHLWDEDAHPRGQPDNAGQFIAKDEAPAQRKEPEAEDTVLDHADDRPAEATKPKSLTFGDWAKSPDGHFGKISGGSMGSDQVSLVDASGRGLGYYDRNDLKPPAWKDLEKAADEAKAHGDYATAADHLERAAKEYDGDNSNKRYFMGEAAARARKIADRQPLPPPHERTAPRNHDPRPPKDADEFLTLSETMKAERNRPGGFPSESRTKPVEDHGTPLGAWRIDDQLKGIYGHQIEQLRELDPHRLVFSEDMAMTNDEGRGDDAERYRDWRKEGRRPPPISVIETENGDLRITDGHRRARAAQLAGLPIEAWVSPAVPTGKIDSNGNEIKTGLTWEMVKNKRGELDQKDKWHDPENPPSELKVEKPKAGGDLSAKIARAKAIHDEIEAMPLNMPADPKPGDLQKAIDAREAKRDVLRAERDAIAADSGLKASRPLKKEMHFNLVSRAKAGDKLAQAELDARDTDTRRQEDPAEIAKHFGGEVPSLDQVNKWMNSKDEDPHPGAKGTGGKPTDEEMEHFYFLHGAARYHEKQAGDKNVKQAGDATAIEFTRTTPGGGIGKILVHPSTKYPGTWQLSEVGRDGKPWGDTNFKTKENALRAIAGESVEGEMSYGRPGEWEITGKMGGKPAEAPGFALERETVPKAPEPPAAYREYTEMMGKAGLEPRPFKQWEQDRKETLAKQQQAAGAKRDVAAKAENAAALPKVGDRKSVGGIGESTLRKHAQADGISYQLWENAAGEHYLHAFDVDSGSMIEGRKYGTGRKAEAAQAFYNAAKFADEEPAADPLQGKYDEYRSMMQGAKLTPRPFEDWKKGLKPQAEPAKSKSIEDLIREAGPVRHRVNTDSSPIAASQELAGLRRQAVALGMDASEFEQKAIDEAAKYADVKKLEREAKALEKRLAGTHPTFGEDYPHETRARATTRAANSGKLAESLRDVKEALSKAKGAQSPTAEEIELAGGPDSIGHDTLKLLAGHSKASYGNREFVADIRKKAGERFAGFDAMVKELEEKAGDNSTLREMLAEARPRRDIIARVLAHHDADPSISLQAPPPAAELKERAKADEDQQASNRKWDGAKHAKTAAKLREMADSMAEAADADLGRDRLTNTSKRARQAGHAISDAYRRQAEANTLRNIADHLEGGNAEHLRGVKNRAQVEALDTALRQGFNNRTRNNYAEYERDKEGHRTEADAQAAKFPFPFVHKDHVKNIAEAIRGKPGTAKAIARATRLVAGTEYGAKAETQADIDALDELIGLGEHFGAGHSATHAVRMLKDERKEYNRLVSAGITPDNFNAALEEYRQLKSYGEREPAWKKLERGLIGRKIPGFFPTPKTVIGKMLDRAKIEPGMSVLEPSAGKGDILDALKSRHPEAQAKALEISGDLRAVIEGKGHTVAGEDFLEHGEKYDRVIGNPPFENHQDIDHLRHAYSLLKPGGRVVFVMSSGPFFREQNKDREFREWFDSIGGEVEDLPQGSFAGSDAFRQTGVSTKLVTIDKPQ